MSKSLKILLISLMCTFFIFSVNCFAVNIEMNLSSNVIDYNIETLSNNIDNNVASNVSDSNSNTVSSNIETSNTVSGSVADDSAQDFTSEASTSLSNRNTSVSDTLTALPESELGLTNILNILLITVGVVLILLSIAIFIRLKK